MISIKNIPGGASEASRAQPTGCACGGSDLRCGCGSLLARYVAGAVELKCRRCKRTWRIPVQTGP